VHPHLLPQCHPRYVECKSSHFCLLSLKCKGFTYFFKAAALTISVARRSRDASQNGVKKSLPNYSLTLFIFQTRLLEFAFGPGLKERSQPTSLIMVVTMVSVVGIIWAHEKPEYIFNL